MLQNNTELAWKKQFVGIEELKRKHGETLKLFTDCHTSQNYTKIHHNHYDWWAFPLNESSSYGLKYTLTRDAVRDLKKDQQYLANLREGVRLLISAWGWDLEKDAPITYGSPEEEKFAISRGRAWANWPVRLFKATRCMQLFEQQDFVDHLMKFIDFLEQNATKLDFHSTHHKKTLNMRKALAEEINWMF